MTGDEAAGMRGCPHDRRGGEPVQYTRRLWQRPRPASPALSSRLAGYGSRMSGEEVGIGVGCGVGEGGA
jgi:hypothetical protein